MALFLTATFGLAQDTPLRVGDPVEIRIGGVPADDAAMINNVYSVGGDGSINLPHIGKVRAAGLTPANLATAIQGAYKAAEIFTNPTIAIAQQAASRFVTVGGQVKSPQRVPYTSDLTILAAIEAAGGVTDFANRKKVVLLSGGKRYMVDLNVIVNSPKEDIPLSPGDQIQVPQSPW